MHYYFSVTKGKQEQCLAFKSRSVYEYLYLSLRSVQISFIFASEVLFTQDT